MENKIKTTEETLKAMGFKEVSYQMMRDYEFEEMIEYYEKKNKMWKRYAR